MKLAYFKVYRDFIDIARELDNGARGRLFMALLQYVNDEEPTNLTGAERIAFLTMKSQIDRDEQTYDDVSKSRSEAGIKGAKKRWNKEENGNEKMANANFAILPYGKNGNCHKEKEKDKDKDNKEILSIDSTKKPQKAFVPPTLEEVREYARKRGSEADPDRFFEYYDVSNWVDSKGNKVKNWKQRFITWEDYERRHGNVRRDAEKGSKAPSECGWNLQGNYF